MVGGLLAHYRIVELLGKGGMGEVYAAVDSRLERKVALKILPTEMAGDRESRLRFQREAKSIAALDHPNIVTIYSVEESADGTVFMTMQLVEGNTLADVSAGEEIDLARLLDLFVAITDGVSAAHERGIVHRDLKPANIMVTPGGVPKILDFGLAKLAATAADSEGATASMHLTSAGTIMGTVPYMSPEQAAGKEADTRSDIFSLGIMLYETATGTHPFGGDTPITVLSSIIKDTPAPITIKLPKAPRELGRVIRRALEKDPERRYQSVKDMCNDLRELRARLDWHESASGRMAGGVRRVAQRWGRQALLASTAVVALSFAVWLGRGLTAPPASPPPLGPATFSQLTTRLGVEMFPSISPDGEWLLYESSGRDGVHAFGNKDIYLQAVGGTNAINLTVDYPEADDREPAFSPDGRTIAFASDRDGGGIYIMGRTGERPRRLTTFGFHPAWSPDGTEIAFSTESVWVPIDPNAYSSSQLWAVRIDDGSTRLILEGNPVQPSWSPDGGRIAFWGFGETGRADVWTVPAEGGQAVPAVRDEATNWNPVWAPDGQHLYFVSTRSGPYSLFRVAIDSDTGAVQAAPEMVSTPSPGAMHISLSESGKHLAYTSISNAANVEWWPFDPQAEQATGPKNPVTRGNNLFYNPEVSPDDAWVAFISLMPQQDLFVARPDGSGLRNLTDDNHLDGVPRWSPDSRAIAFHSNRGGRYEIWSVQSDGTGLTRLTRANDSDHFRPFWSPDGTRLGYSDTSLGTVIVSLDVPLEERSPQPLPPFGGPDVRFEGYSWSPDGRWIVGHRFPPVDKEESTLGVLALDLQSGEYRELSDRGWSPTWLPDSRRIMYQAEGALHIVDLDTATSREVMRAPVGSISYRFSLSSRGDRVYTAVDNLQSDIWLLSTEPLDEAGAE